MLKLIQAVHTVIWAIVAGSVLAIPAAALLGRIVWAFGLTAFVLLECIMLVINRSKCPLTDVAARFTAGRKDNFDIYLPNW